MDQREGDSRIYFVALLFLSCIVSGGILLGLYLFLPDPNPLFLQAGMVFVGIPWIFWLLAYVYSCVLKPCIVSISNNMANSKQEKGEQNNNKQIPENATSHSDPVAAAATTPREGEKQVVPEDDEGSKKEKEEENRI